jgi:uncharacterized protein (DUF2336 family)
MALTAQSLLADLDAALPQASDTWRGAALRQMVKLFLAGAESYSGEQVAVFDEVMCRLIKKKLDRTQLTELSNKLAGIGNAPPRMLASLARNSDIAVSGPVLEQAKALPDAEFAEIADKDRGNQNVLAKIAARSELSEPVTDILLKHGNAAVRRKILDNPQAQVSEMGFALLVSGINGDKSFAAAIMARKELPDELRPFVEAALSQ